jgi:hypothetical protein
MERLDCEIARCTLEHANLEYEDWENQIFWGECLSGASILVVVRWRAWKEKRTMGREAQERAGHVSVAVKAIISFVAIAITVYEELGNGALSACIVLAAVALMSAMLYLCMRDMRRIFPVWTRSLLWISIIVFMTDIVLWVFEADIL